MRRAGARYLLMNRGNDPPGSDMATSNDFSGALYAALVRGGAARLFAERAAINDLNVFPIPDGDTGDNMYMTIAAGAAEAPETGSLGAVSAAVAHAMLLGARGNSGVILSRIFAGLADGFAGHDAADGETVAAALRAAVKAAYDAVGTPVEGTILTVFREAAEYAAGRLASDSSPERVLSDFRAEAARSLDRTPELLPVLREAGVVDSGGAGLLAIADGMLDALGGKTGAAPTEISAHSAAALDFSLFGEDSVLEYGYCTELLLRLQTAKTDPARFDIADFTRELEALGDSVVAFRDGSIVKLHVHTKTPGDILALGQRYGEFLTVKIENMTLQHSGAEEKKAKRAPHKPYAAVAVASGAGIRETFLSMGADAVVDGGQSMNPSAADFIEAFRTVNADTILVFPGNGNILLAAGQAASLYKDADVRVVPCRSIPETYAALSALDTSSGDTDAILALLAEEIGSVVSAGVAAANRTTEMDGVAVRAGDYVGFSDGVILADDADRTETILALAEKLKAEQYGVMVLIPGSAVPAGEARAARDKLAARYRRTEVILLDGGQPVEDYIILLQ